MRAAALRLALALLWGGQLGATDITALTPAERQAFGAAVKSYLMANPSVIPQALSAMAPTDLYAEDREADLSIIARHKALLFDRTADGFGDAEAAIVIALIGPADCAPCQSAEADLRALAKRYDIRVRRLTPQEAAPFVDAMQITDLPAYAFDDMVLNGAMPAEVMEGYIAQRLDKERY
ncbi:MAG: hypothetical protein ACRBBT_11660 [Paracoccaceae bacterium]